MVTRGKVVLMRTREMLAYAAGIVDGEGCVQYVANTAGDRPGVKGSVRVSVGNTDMRLIAWLHDRFGGHITTRRKLKRHHKQSWDWVVASGGAIDFLKKIEPFLLIKKERASFLLENAYLLTGHSTKRNVPRDEMKIALREAMSMFNARGLPPATTKRDGPDRGCNSLNCNEYKLQRKAEVPSRLREQV